LAHFVGRNRLLDCGQSDRETETDRQAFNSLTLSGKATATIMTAISTRRMTTNAARY